MLHVHTSSWLGGYIVGKLCSVSGFVSSTADVVFSLSGKSA